MEPGMGMTRRYRSLLKVNEMALNTSSAEGAFRGLCGALKKVVPYDRAGLSLYDAERDCLRIIGLDGPHENSVFHVGQVLSRQDTQSGWVFEHKARMFRRDLEKELRFPADQRILDEGYSCLCTVPLIAQGNSIGVVTVLSEQKNRLSDAHADVVQEMSNQIALAVNSVILKCPNHANTRLVCPRCIGAAGGRATVSKHREDLSKWGKQGGRGRKNIE
jgi:formate hydrogenlyase transcriptional activator